MLNTRFLFLSIILLLGFSITSCEDETEDMGPDDENVAMLNVNDQVLSQNTIVIPSVDIPREGWAVLHRDNGSGGPVVPGIISEPISLSTGKNESIKVPILPSESLTDGRQYG